MPIGSMNASARSLKHGPIVLDHGNADRASCRVWNSVIHRCGGLALPESVFHVALNHDCKGAPLSLSGWGIGNGRAGVLGLLHCMLDVFDREVRPHDRLLMRCQ